MITVVVWYLVAVAYLFFLLKVYKEPTALFLKAYWQSGIFFAVGLFGLYLSFYISAGLFLFFPLFRRGIPWRQFAVLWPLTALFLIAHYAVFVGLQIFLLSRISPH